MSPLSRLLVDRPPADFAHAVAATAALVRTAGGRRGLVVADDGWWAAVGLFALLHAGAEAVLPPNGQPASLAAAAAACDMVLTDRARPGLERPTLLPAIAPGDHAITAPLAPDALLTFFTSGSTGGPKQVPRTIAMLEHEVAGIDALLAPLVPQSAVIHGTVSHQHVYGLAFRLLWPLASGRVFAGIVHDLWETVLPALQPGDALITSPAHLARTEGLGAPAHRPGLVLSAGAPLPEAAAMAAAALFGTPVTEIFGSTETGAIAWRRRDRPDPAWQALDGTALDRGPDGTLRVRGPAIPGLEYLGADLVTIDATGGIRFAGRADRIVKIEGNRLSLDDLEAALLTSGLIADAAAITLPGPPPCAAAVVVPTATGAAELDRLGPFRFGRLLRRTLAATLEPAGLPRQWRFVAALPAADLGKRRHHALAALFAAPTVSDAAIRPTEPDIRAVRRSDDAVELDLDIPADLLQVNGHFPGFPVVPGVAQIDWAVTFAARYLGLAIETAQAFQVKFRRVTQPGMPVVLALRHQPARRRISFEYRADGEILTTGTIPFEAT